MRARLVVYGLLLVLAFWSIAVEPGWVQQRDLTLAADTQERVLTIAVASDLHVGAPHIGREALRRLVDRINAAQPDLILLPGDFVIRGLIGGETVLPEATAADLAALRAPLGVYATLD